MPIGVSESSLVWQASRDVAALIDPDGGIVIDLTGGRCHSLNGIGAFLWSRLSAAGGAPMDETVSAVQAAAADTPPSVQRDIDTFLAAMAARGLIESIALEDRHFGLGGVMRQRFVVAACLIAMVTVAISAQSGSPGQKPADQSHQGHSMQMADGDFANLMMRHHRDGIAMAKLEESGGTSAEVKALAAKIRQGQEKDLAELDTFAKKHKPSKMAAMHEKKWKRNRRRRWRN